MPLIPAMPRALLALLRRVARGPPTSQHRSRISSSSRSSSSSSSSGSSSSIDRALLPLLPYLAAPLCPPPAARRCPRPTATLPAPSRTTTTGQGLHFCGLLRCCGVSAPHPLVVFRNDSSDKGGGSNHGHRQQQRRRQEQEQDQQEQRASAAASPLAQHRHVFMRMSEQVQTPALCH
jgi:hypothetical protein